MVVIMYNCKRCKKGRRVEYPEKSLSGAAGRRDELGQWFPPMGFVTAIGGGKPTEYGGDPLAICKDCGNLMSQGKIKGLLRPDVPCDARCTGARGHSCDCSCGGANHGRDWA